ncbi:MAG: hypothetical protein R6U26_01605 [Candidatus Undinarchaeales archaeon]
MTNKFYDTLAFHVIPFTAGFLVGYTDSLERDIPEISQNLECFVFLCPTAWTSLYTVVKFPEQKKNLEAEISVAQEKLESRKEKLGDQIYRLEKAQLDFYKKKVEKLSTPNVTAKAGIKTLIKSSIGYALGRSFKYLGA